MRIKLTNEDVNRLMEYPDDVEIEFDAAVWHQMGLAEAVRDAINKQTLHAGPLYQEIHKQVDEYVRDFLPTKVGNYIRTEHHTIHKIVDAKIKSEIDSGIKSGIKLYAKRTAERIVAEFQIHAD